MANDSIEFCESEDAWWKYLLLPFVAGVVGYATNVLAIKMMFYPIEYFGIDLFRCKDQPFGLIGWQGVVPCKIEKIAGKTVDIILENLLDVKEVFDRLDPEKFSEVMGKGLMSLVDKVISKTAKEYKLNLSQEQKDEIVVKASIESNAKFLQNLIKDMQEQVYDILDIRHMCLTKIVANKPQMNDIFLEIGREEFKFIKQSGFYFGFLFGMVQMIIWCFHQGVWVLPCFGLMVGWATNWLAIKVIFRPLDPIYICGFKIHGLFCSDRMK